MLSEINIQYIRQADIDRTKWDECIRSSHNGLIYSYSWYLDQMAKHWDGLVLNDYEAVMPLTWNRKYSINYLYQPFLTAQLGVVGRSHTEEIINAFIHAIPKRFSYWDFNLNYNSYPSKEVVPYFIRKNYILPLNKPYEKVSSGYNDNTLRNIKKSQSSGCRPVKGIDKSVIIEMAVMQMSNYTNESKDNIDRFKKLSDLLVQKGQLQTYGILNARQELIASCIFLSSHNRFYYILVGNSPESRSTGASHALIDSFIKDHAGENNVLDFEGSDIPGVGNFYRSFGAVEENYPAIRLNKLPFFLRWLKK